jgi:hypothetical protein
MDRALFVGAGFALLGALIALVWLPNRAAPPEGDPEPDVLYEEVEVVPAL